MDDPDKREASQDNLVERLRKLSAENPSPRDCIDEAADEIERLRVDLVSCRGTVKTELAHYERLAMVHGKTVLAANYEAEAQRLSDLLDRIDALTATPAAGRTE